jgi:DMSO/TMAO reductase YedYZ molybdopterin-dependent catalytic subunit
MVSKPVELTLADLQKLPQQTLPAVIECTGNGRNFYSPKVPDIQWGWGAIGNAEWIGPRVSDVLKLAGASESAAFIETDGADVGLASTPDFIRTLPMKKAMHPGTLVAPQDECAATSGYPRRVGEADCTWMGWSQLCEMGDPYLGGCTG